MQQDDQNKAAAVNSQSQPNIAAATTQTGQTGSNPAPASDDPDIEDGKFKIPKSVIDKYPDLIELVKKTESMNDDERQYWFQILPIMTDEQVKKFREILENERDQLAKLDQEYEQEIKKINEKYSSDAYGEKKKKTEEQLKKAEKAAEVEEKAEEEKLLEDLTNL